MDTSTLIYGAMLGIGLGYALAAKLWRKAFFWIFLGLAVPAYCAFWAYLGETSLWAGGLSALVLLFFLGVLLSALLLKRTDTPARHVLSPLEILAMLFITPPLVVLVTLVCLHVPALIGRI